MEDDPSALGDILFIRPGSASDQDIREDREVMAMLERRVHEKIADYNNYEFSKVESRALNIFFDLAQEFPDIQHLWALCVVIPKVFFNKHATLYLLSREGELEWRCCTRRGCAMPDNASPSPPVPFVAKPTLDGERYLIPIKGNHELISQLPFVPKHDMIGLLEILPGMDLTPHEELFFEKYANRIGFRLHNRIIAQTNREHLRFIKSLVEDIGHNVIVPNMYFKLYYRRLESKIEVLRDISSEFSKFTTECAVVPGSRVEDCERLQREMDYAFESLMEQYNEIYRHYEQTSLFLETLLRRSHFEQGRYVLEMRPCALREQILEPQLERYRPRLEDRHIAIAEPEIPQGEEDLRAELDVGLISQVVANMFSNAVKYSQPTGPDQTKEVRFGYRLLPDYFGEGQPGVRLHVYSTGPNLDPAEASKLYSEGFRGSNSSNEYGTGHGLSFIKEVVSLHRGVVGYEPHEHGNLFFLIIPLHGLQLEDQPAPAEADSPRSSAPGKQANPAS